MKVIGCIAKILIIIGALNWGLIGFFQYDLISAMFGGMSMMGARVIFALVGLAGLYKLLGCTVCRKCCSCGCKSCGSSGCNCKNKQM